MYVVGLPVKSDIDTQLEGVLVGCGVVVTAGVCVGVGVYSGLCPSADSHTSTMPPE